MLASGVGGFAHTIMAGLGLDPVAYRPLCLGPVFVLLLFCFPMMGSGGGGCGEDAHDDEMTNESEWCMIRWTRSLLEYA